MSPLMSHARLVPHPVTTGRAALHAGGTAVIATITTTTTTITTGSGWVSVRE